MRKLSIRAADLLAAIKSNSFSQNEVMNLILNLLAPADKILQQRSTSLVEGYDVINSTITMIRKLKTSFKNTAKASTTSAKSQFHRDSEDVITEHIGIHNESESLNLKPSYFEIIDIIQSEFSHRFSCSFTGIELLSRQGRITTSLLFVQFNYRKCQ